jgi:hypothetical protein
MHLDALHDQGDDKSASFVRRVLNRTRSCWPDPPLGLEPSLHFGEPFGASVAITTPLGWATSAKKPQRGNRAQSRAMEFTLIWRLMLVGIAAYWVLWIAIAVRKPRDWRPPRAEKFPFFTITRDRFIVGGVAGIAVCVVLLVASFLIPGFLSLP